MENNTTTKQARTAAYGPHPEPLARFIDEVEAMRESMEGERLAFGVTDALGKLLGERDWLLSEYRLGYADRFRTHVVHVAPDGGFSIVAVVWQPGQTTPIHDHISWCVVGVYEGVEEENLYHLYEKDDRCFLVESGLETAHPGEVTTLIPPEEDIHRVTNAGQETAISIHVYGADIGKLGSSINHVFDGLPVLRDPEDARRIAWRR